MAKESKFEDQMKKLEEIVDKLEKQAKNQLNINLSIHMDPVY